MPRKKKDFITRVQPAELIGKSRELREKGYSLLMPGDARILRDCREATWADFIGSQLRGVSASPSPSWRRRSVPSTFFYSGGENHYGAAAIGTPGLGWMEWGMGNALPNIVSFLTCLQPYTAAGMKFNADICAGLGPQPMYDTAQYVGGNITTRFIRYKDAGLFLRGLIADRQRELYNLLRPESGAEKPAAAGFTALADNLLPASGSDNAPLNAELVRRDLAQGIHEEIAKLKDDLEEWERTEQEVDFFIRHNNLPYTWLALATDQELFGLSFPEIQLNQQEVDSKGKPVDTELWKPRVIGLSYRPCHTTRLERMDSNHRINYVYCSDRWLDTPFVNEDPERDSVIALPCLDVNHPTESLFAHIREARRKRVATGERPTRFVLPSVYPSAGRPYYPTPAWHSIFGGDIYEYLSTILSDRLTRKRNSSIIGRVIYIHSDYLQQLFTQAGVNGNAKEKEKLRDRLYNQINTWLANRNNAGQSLLAFTFMGADGKEHRSFEIVEIAADNKSAAEANEKETAEISSIEFLAMGLDHKLVGSSPLSMVGSSGGTDLRERYLLRLLLKSPTQNIMLKTMQVVSDINGWDSHLVWQIQREVMTTLDNSKTGITAHASDNVSNS